VFADRLVNDEDRTWFSSLLGERITADFNASFDDVVTTDPLLYADFMALSQDSRTYVEITDHTKVRLVKLPLANAVAVLDVDIILVIIIIIIIIVISSSSSSSSSFYLLKT